MRRKEEVFSQISTPAYVFDLDLARKTAEELKTALSGSGKGRLRLCYAMKANPFLAGKLLNCTDLLEVCSPGEERICELQKIPPECLVISGVSKKEEDIRKVLSYGMPHSFTVESMAQLELLTRLAKERKEKFSLLLRLTSGNQFGLDEADLEEAVKKAAENPWVTILGIQYYSGTQKKHPAQIQRELERLDGLARRLTEVYGIELKELEYGPGLPVCYFQSEKPMEEILESLKEGLKGLSFEGTVTLEMGRCIAAACGSYVTEVVDCKKNLDVNYCITDGGIHQVNYYGQTMAMKLPYYRQIPERLDGPEEKWNVCGSLCTVSDVLVKQLPLQGLKVGDRLVFERTGAYSVTEGIALFLSRDLPEVYFWSGKKGLEKVRNRIESFRMNTWQADGNH